MKQDTIAAIATAPGAGGIGIIRISGAKAETILQTIFFPAQKNGFPMESHRLIYGKLRDGDGEIDECMAVLMRAPRSYTREDVAELQIHGGTYVLNRGLAACLKAGARLAEAGEFTRRAFLNGRIDLSRAEAVMGLISARGEAEHRAAIRQMDGGASAFVGKISEKLSLLQAGLAACIDYPEEISEEEGTRELEAGISVLIAEIRGAIDEHAARILRDGLHVALYGKPNVGKSSLLNAMLQEDKAIVTDVPGTTRDPVEGEIFLNGVRVMITDTAGIRETEDPVEKIGVQRSERVIRNADLAVLIVDGSREPDEEDLRFLEELPGNGLALINKNDLECVLDEDAIRKIRPDVRCMTVSAMQPESLIPLKELISGKAAVSERAMLTQPRHLDALRRAAESLGNALDTLSVLTCDMVSTELQEAQEALCEITGEKADEKLLDTVFSQFCVGK